MVDVFLYGFCIVGLCSEVTESDSWKWVGIPVHEHYLTVGCRHRSATVFVVFSLGANDADGAKSATNTGIGRAASDARSRRGAYNPSSGFKL